MYHTLLVPLDGSKRAERILPHVEEMAQRYDAQVVFMHVIESPSVDMASEGGRVVPEQVEVGQQEQQVSTYLDALVGGFREKEIVARSHIVFGPVVEAIIDEAEAVDADLIAMASHGRTGLSQVFYGSAAAGVLQRVDRPLLLIRARDGE